METQGQVLIVVLVLVRTENLDGDRNRPFSFSWDSVVHEDDGDAVDVVGGIFNSASYIDTAQGRFARKKLNYPQKTVLALNSPRVLETEFKRSTSDRRLSIEGEITFGPCDLIDPCECSYFGLYEILPSGYLREVHR